MPPWPLSTPTIEAVAALLVVVVAALLLVFLRRRPAPTIEKRPEEGVARPVGRVRAALTKTGESFRQRLAEVFGGNREREAILSSLEEALLGADVGVPTTTRILQSVREQCSAEREPAEPTVREALRRAIEQALG